jgi:hypothetical protein
MQTYVVRVVKLERSVHLVSGPADSPEEATKQATKLVKNGLGMPLTESEIARVYAEQVFDEKGAVVKWRYRSNAPWNQGVEFKEG